MLTLATFNLCNLGADAPADRFARLAEIITRDLEAPDILALQEIKAIATSDEQLAIPADAAYQRLIQAIIEKGGPRYSYCEIPPLAEQDGGHTGFNIRVGLLFNRQRVMFNARSCAGPEDAVAIETVAKHPQLSANPGRIAPQHPAFTGDLQRHWAPARKALVAEFLINDKSLFVIVCHLKSMRANNRREREYTKKQRHAQAEVLHDFAAQLLHFDPDGHVVVLGDMNDSTGSKTLDLLKGRILCNLLEKIPKRQRYSFRAGSSNLALDHVLVSRSLWVTGVARVAHVNSGLPQDQQASDHDPVWVSVDL